ncbi:MAG: bifunctional nuclease family protein [Moorellales bacterium]
MLIPLKVRQVVLDQSLSPVVLLVDGEEKRVLPIWIGPFEAQAIAMALEGIMTPRPMTHDLLRSVCENLEAKVERIVVSDLRDGTYYAEIFFVRSDGREVVVDSRPSDAIALALRCGAELYMTDKVASYALSVDELMKAQQEAEPTGGKVINLEDYKKTLH